MSSPDLSGWLLTYAVHSTVLLTLAWLVAGRVTSHRVRETIWKTALFGGFFTATGQIALRLQPLGGRMIVPAATAVAALPESQSLPATPAGSELRDADLASNTESQANPDVPPSPMDPMLLLLAAWGVVAGILLARYGFRKIRFLRRMAGRRQVIQGPLAEMLRELRASAGVARDIRLTASAALSSPVALGSAEIAIPEAALTDLEPGQQASMLAHELAHLERRDPFWLTAACVVECIGFFNPMHRFARRKMQESAEYLCDEWAVRRTGSGVLLAKCLAKVAEWLETAPASVPVAGMAEDHSHLVSRVKRLLDGGPFPKAPAGRTLAFASVLMIGVTAVAIPGVSLARHPAGGTQDPAESTQEASREEESLRQAPSDTGQAIVNALLGVAKDPNVEVRRAAIRSLGQHQSRAAIPVLREALRDTDTEVRVAALEALGEMEDVGSASAIAALLKDGNREVRARAIEALASLELPSPPPGLRDALRDPDAEVRHRAAHAVGHFEDTAAVPALRGLLDDPNAEVREAAVEALASIRDDAAIQALIGALKSKDAKVREAAADALGRKN